MTQKLAIKNYPFSVLIVAALLFLSVINCSRAFLIGTTISLLYLALAHGIISWGLRTKVLLCAGTILLALSLAFFVKSDSSEGRLLIYKVSSKMFLQEPVMGIGLGKFKVEYNSFQSKYFAGGHYTTKELLLAGDTYYAFNDIWELLIEIGIVGMLMVVPLMVLIVVQVIKSLSRNSDNDMLKLAAALLITGVVASLFTHVFSHWYYQIICLCSLSVVIIYADINLKPAVKRVVVTGTLFVLVLVLNIDFIAKYAERKEFKKAQQYEAMGYLEKSKMICDSIYPSLKRDVGFIRFYSDLALTMNDARMASILTDFRQISSEHQLYLKAAKYHEIIGDTARAETDYLTSIHTVPNRFIPRKYLFDLYFKTHQQQKAIKMAAEINSLPVKIPSMTILKIKESVSRQITMF